MKNAHAVCTRKLESTEDNDGLVSVTTWTKFTFNATIYIHKK